MKKVGVVFWGLLTLLPVAYLFVFFFLFDWLSTLVTSEEQRIGFGVLWGASLVMVALIWGLVTTYLVYLFKTSHVPAEKKALWAAVIFLGNIFTMPVFWFIYVWKPVSKKQNVAA